ncbi:NAD(P)-dependent oxidoreductase [Anaerotruncus rubiinfantis]|uniref:NAD(P)-dependent oxidoreductase n=1 Tax=Anaerotruncus rubiinfantis TaxID=1720200 RepID=UPI0009AED417|nr:NAD(P)-dependent oxidoreductase [Anaerotruncus rubiinfantis]
MEDFPMKKIGFIGLGVMGQSMARNLMKAGFSLTVYNRTKSKADGLIAEGAAWADTPGQCAKDQDAVITIVGYPKDVHQVYFNEDGILANAKPGAYLIDMTTTSPKLSIEIYEAAKARGIFALDAPVSGGDVGAKNATLAIMVGGDQAAFDTCMPIFSAMGQNIRHMGAAGAGQHTKMANQIAIAGAVAGVCEALAYAKAAGLDLQGVLDAISTGAAGSWQMSNNAPRMLAGDYAPGFFIKHYIKDLVIAKEGVDGVSLSLPVAEVVLGMYQQLQEEGFGDDGTQALIKYYK